MGQQGAGSIHGCPPRSVAIRSADEWKTRDSKARLVFVRDAFRSYREAHRVALDTAVYLSSSIAGLGPYEHIAEGDSIPVFAFTLRPDRRLYTLHGRAAVNEGR